jgi:putative membrane protein
MAFLSDSDRARIEAAVIEAERSTAGEIVAVVARQAGGYRAAPVIVPALLALLMPAIALTVAPELSAWRLYVLQALVFVALAAVAHLPAVRLALVPASARQRRARQLARQQFVERGLHLTRGRTGVLIFVSVAEHHVEIVADEGIDRVVPPGTWDKAVAAFVAEVRAGRVAEGFLAIIAEVGGQLARYAPRQPDDVDERPNRLVEL